MFSFITDFFVQLFKDIDIPLIGAKTLAYLIIIIGLVIFWIILSYILKTAIRSIVKFVNRKKSSIWNIELLQTKFFSYVGALIPSFILQKLISQFFVVGTKAELLFLAIVNIGIIINFTLIVTTFVRVAIEVFLQKEATKDKPVKSYFQVLLIIVWLVSIILIISILVNKSPSGLLAGIGAFSAVLLLVFQDTITGFVNSIQLSTNDLVRNGDWITMNKFGVDGTVEEINLTSVKVRNFDNTISTIPVKQMISDSFQNWRGMDEKGLRRIKRALPIDITSILTCTPEMIANYKQIDLIRDDMVQIQNVPHLTNFRVFRLYLLNYLKNNPNISKDSTVMVRQLSPNEYGAALELYCFSNTTEWLKYEDIQSEIFEHIYSILPLFDIRSSQKK